MPGLSSPLFREPSLTPLTMTPHMSPRSQFTLSQALVPSRGRINKNRTVSHTIKLDFSNMRSCTELSRLNLLYADQHIRNLPSTLHKASSLHELTIVIISDTWQQKYQKSFYNLLRTLPKLKSISRLNLYFSNCRILDRRVIKELTTSLRHLKKLKACNIRVHWCPNMSYQDIPKLLMPLRYHALKEITISFYGLVSHLPQKSKASQIQQPMNILRKFRQCHSVGLEFDLNTAFTDSDLIALANGIKRLTGLQSFCLRLGTKDPLSVTNITDSITDQGLLKFMAYLHELPFLKELLLHVMNCKKLSEEGVRQCVTSYFDPSHYRKLSYKFDGFVMSKSTKMLAFADFLSQFNDPKDITLRVLSCPDFAISYKNSQGRLADGEIKLCCDVPAALHWEDYHMFAKAFSQLSSLKAFNFSNRDCAYTWELTQQIFTPKPLPDASPYCTYKLPSSNIITDELIKGSHAMSLINLLTNLTNLQGLSLRLPYCASIPEETLVCIMTLLASLTHLKHLAITFVRCQRITDAVMLALVKSIGQYRYLENLNIQFEVIKSITNKSVLRLIEVIQTINSLKNLSLNFQDCVLLTAQCIQGLPEALTGLTELQGLSLVFPGIAETSNLELQRLSNSICKLTELSNIKLDFSNSEEISDGGLYALGKSVMQAGKVRYLEIYLDNCWKLGNEGICQVAKYFKSLKELFSLKMSLKGCMSITTEGVNQLIGEMCAVEKLEFLTLDFGTGDHSGEVFHRADVFLKFERMENISLNLRAGKDIFPQRVGELRKKLGEIRQVAIFFK